MKITSTIVRLQQDDDGAFTGLVETPGNAQRLVYQTPERGLAEAFTDVCRQHGQRLAETV